MVTRPLWIKSAKEVRVNTIPMAGITAAQHRSQAYGRGLLPAGNSMDVVEECCEVPCTFPQLPTTCPQSRAESSFSRVQSCLQALVSLTWCRVPAGIGDKVIDGNADAQIQSPVLRASLTNKSLSLLRRGAWRLLRGHSSGQPAAPLSLLHSLRGALGSPACQEWCH